MERAADTVGCEPKLPHRAQCTPSAESPAAYACSTIVFFTILDGRPRALSVSRSVTFMR